MGYSGYLDLKLRAKKLREKGLSYKEIQRTIPVSKSTLSMWCRDIALTEQQALRLFKNRLVGAEKGRIIGAKRQQLKRLNQVKELLEKGRQEIGRLTVRDRFIAGISLYAAEGTKMDKANGFANSDPLLIFFMSFWFRKFCHVPESKLRGAIWLHQGLNELKAKKFWSKLSGIPLSQFHKTYVAKRKPKSLKIRKNIHPYGVFSIRFSDAKIHRKLMGWIEGVFGKDVKYQVVR